MTSKLEKLPHSRIKISVTADANDLAHPVEHAVHHLTGNVAVKGFRPGKAPKPMLIAQVGKGRILSELVDHALPELVYQVTKKEKVTVIESPAYTLEKLCELNDDGTPKADTILAFTAEMDIAPTVNVGDYSKLKIVAVEPKSITDNDVAEFIAELARRRAPWEPVDRVAKKDDRVTLSFSGKRNGIPENRLKSDDYPVILGSNVMIPGFEDQLIGKKAGSAHTFEITFPTDYHTKDLAGQKVIFDVKINEIAEQKLPALDVAFAKKFDHNSMDSLKKAIREEREFYAAERAKADTQTAVLEAFEKLVEVEIPKSLLEKETDRQIETIRTQITSQGLKFDSYLEHLKKTEEQLRDDIKPTASKAVRIGLGLGNVADKEGIKDKDSGPKAIEKLVAMATDGKVVKKT